MHHEIRHRAACTCGRFLEVIIRTPGPEKTQEGTESPVNFSATGREDEGDTRR